ncbi:hypothetical protein C8Q80DRAFT_1197383 [Daedaleopsis nitida]|nr:hypothetical protein C8Q80DRAFT_1197383 [Daedaleopsis nitida]
MIVRRGSTAAFALARKSILLQLPFQAIPPISRLQIFVRARAPSDYTHRWIPFLGALMQTLVGFLALWPSVIDII